MLHISKEEREHLKKDNHWNSWDQFFCQPNSLVYFILLGILMAFITWAEMEYRIIDNVIPDRSGEILTSEHSPKN